MRVVFFVLMMISVYESYGQIRELDVILVDKVSYEPVEDAHVFIGSATYGTVSNKDGMCSFSIPSDVTKELVISHISYDVKVLQFSKYNLLEKNDTIYLEPNGINLDEIVIEGKKARKWKKNYRKFSKAFIGKGKRASLCEIRNPEVLRFSNEDGVFKATAIDMLKIKNHYLGYDVDFLLSELTIDKNGSMKYFGYPKFTDRSHKTNEVELEENREEAYRKSLSHFLLNLISNNLKEAKYKIKLKRYTGSEFIEMSSPKPQDIVYLDSLSGLYHILFEDFLEVKHLGIKQMNDASVGMSIGALESMKFGSNSAGNSVRVVNPVSMIYKKSPSLVVNRYGLILNQKSVQEYGTSSQNSHKKLIIALDTTTAVIVNSLLYGNKESRNVMLDYVERTWKDSYIPILLDVNKVITSEDLNPRIIELLGKHSAIFDYFNGLQWMWDGDPIYGEHYADAKAEIYQHIDPQFKSYFEGQQETAEVSLDEIVWGGVTHNSIPSLRRPKMIPASEADYLGNKDVIFGIVIDGEAKAYPKRILAWHEFFIDKIGERNIAGVYCTLCGTMIAYDMKHRNEIHDLGTSGFLYRSNKLMYDKKTKSLWNTIDGQPVLGPLAGKGIKLKSYSVVTTTWEQWRRNHPDSQVLDINTGYDRDYSEGRAYKSYFSHDRLMFPVPLEDYRLDNKSEVLIIRSPRYETDPLAISIKYLKKKRIHQDVVADKNILVIAEKNGMSRAYYSKKVKFKSYKKGVLKDNNGNVWTVTDEHLISDSGRKLLRASAHNSFWFAWYNMYPDTRLIK